MIRQKVHIRSTKLGPRLLPYLKILPRQARPRWALLIFALLLLSGCNLASSSDDVEISRQDQLIQLRHPEDLEPITLSEGRTLRIVTSTSIVADVVVNIGGGNLDLVVLIPRGTDPHTYQPTPGDLQALYQADLILLNGLELETDLEDILAPVSHEVAMISLSEGILARTLEEGGNHSNLDTHSAGLDPHVWFDPVLVSYWVDRIELSLSRLDPAHAEMFQVNANRYRAELLDLDQWIVEQVSSLPAGQRKLVLDHLVLGYFAERYGFIMLDALVPGFSSAAEASPREIAELSDMIRTEGVLAIFIGIDTNPRLAVQIAGDLDVQVIELYTGSLGPVGSPAGSYIEMMQYNVLAIKQALSPE